MLEQARLDYKDIRMMRLTVFWVLVGAVLLSIAGIVFNFRATVGELRADIDCISCCRNLGALALETTPRPD